MRERPIIFNSEMVRALLDGRKTQTRQIIKDCPVVQDGWYPDRYNNSEEWTFWGPRGSADAGRCTVPFVKCPFGAVGDRLWVRETFQGPLFDPVHIDAYACDSEPFEKPEYCKYAADGGPRPEYFDADDNLRYGWRSSTSMPRWASRITLEITGVRVDRLHAITLGDICKEFGCGLYDFRPATYGFQAWEKLWQSIYGDESWQANPWVWVIEFKRVEGE